MPIDFWRRWALQPCPACKAALDVLDKKEFNELKARLAVELMLGNSWPTASTVPS